MRGILAAVVSGTLSLGLVMSAHAQAPVGLDPLAGYYGKDRHLYPIVYPQISYNASLIASMYDPNMYPTFCFGGCHGGTYPSWAIPLSPMTSKFYGSPAFPWTWRGRWGGDW